MNRHYMFLVVCHGILSTAALPERSTQPHQCLHRYCKPQHAFYDLAADVMAENPQYVAKHLDPDMQDFLQASIMRQASPEEAFRRFDELANRRVEQLRKLTQQIQVRLS